jgi:hypothetical protein
VNLKSSSAASLRGFSFLAKVPRDCGNSVVEQGSLACSKSLAKNARVGHP